MRLTTVLLTKTHILAEFATVLFNISARSGAPIAMETTLADDVYEHDDHNRIKVDNIEDI